MAGESERLAAERARRELDALIAADDRHDFEFAERGFIATRTDPVIPHDGGGVTSDLRGYDFLAGPPAPTVNPSLWRQAQIITKHGLFKVMDGIYQVRGFDVSTVTFIDAGEGWIVVDPLTGVEQARAAFELVAEHLGARPVLAVIYSHSHTDHYGGVRGIVSPEDVASGKIPVIAPEGFLKEAVSENIIAGPAMLRRARFQFGGTLPRGPEGEVTSGLGPGIPTGTPSLIAPTVDITHTGQVLTIGNVTFEFQVTPETEAPAEMNFYLPGKRAVFMAENANLTMHNLLPARGALVRNAKNWADYLTEAIRLFAGRSEVMFAAHGIPRFGQEHITAFLRSHRDAYKYLHDQTVRLMNNGLTPTEIAEEIRLPESLSNQWYNRGYYGTMSHNSKAVYQRYLGWYDANPVNLWRLPIEEESARYVEAMGGAAAVLARGREAAANGDLRWAATLLNHVIFAGGETAEAREALAGVYTQLGYAAEAGSWRNIYLNGAQELRAEAQPPKPAPFRPEVLGAATTAMILDVAAVRLNPEKANGLEFTINLELTDRKEQVVLSLANCVLVHEEGVSEPSADATLRLTRPEMLMTLFGVVPVDTLVGSGAIAVEGEVSHYAALAAAIEAPIANFNIVIP
ncbi:MAG TPA: alkyl sulfatase dimerization domain-containing protein [Tepidiformaceae bacterium]|nr:alkyl sulfatase dimerization domain-containing protein [Tepidiformaceae bacterium]